MALSALPKGAIQDDKGGFYTPDSYGTYSYQFQGNLRPGVQLPDELKNTTPYAGDSEAQGQTFQHESGSTGPGPDSILVTPTHTYTTNGASNQQPTVTDHGTSTTGGYSDVYGSPEPAYTPSTTTDTHNGHNPAVTTNAQDAAAAQRNPAPAAQTAPTAGWAPGHTGADVKVLQDFLVGKGYMTAAEVATGPGIFGPQTQAALSKYQMDNGTVNGGSPTSTSPETGSGGSQSGSSGQSTYKNEPSTPTKQGKTAVQQVIDDYSTAYNSLGLGDIKTEYQKFVQDQEDLTNKQNDEKQAIDNNPWMSQGVKDRTKDQIDTKYQSRQDALVHKISLLDSLYKQGQMEVENIVNKSEAISMEQQKEATDLAQKQIDAATELRKEATQNSQFQQTLAVQKQNADTSRISATKTSSGGGTVSERQQSALAVYAEVFASGKHLPDGRGIIDGSDGPSKGYATADGWKTLINDYPGTRKDFIEKYGNYIYTTTAKDGTVTIPDSYGLSAQEKKLITG